MADSINGQIGEQGQAPLLVIADESDNATPTLSVMEEPKAPAARPQPSANTKTDAAPSPKSAPLPQPQEAAPARSVAESAAPVRARSKVRPLIPLAAVSLAVFASSVSVIGLLVASRTVAETKTVLAQVQAHQSKMRHLDAVIDEIDALRRREQLALIRLEQINAGRPATGAEVRAAISGLQLSMAKYQPGGNNGTLAMLRDGQAELAERVSTMYRRVERIDEQLGKIAVSSTPRAKRGADREPTS